MKLGMIAMLNSVMFAKKLTEVLESKGKSSFTIKEIESYYGEATCKLLEDLESAEEEKEQEQKESEITQQFGKAGLA